MFRLLYLWVKIHIESIHLFSLILHNWIYWISLMHFSILEFFLDNVIVKFMDSFDEKHYFDKKKLLKNMPAVVCINWSGWYWTWCDRLGGRRMEKWAENMKISWNCHMQCTLSGFFWWVYLIWCFSILKCLLIVYVYSHHIFFHSHFGFYNTLSNNI